MAKDKETTVTPLDAQKRVLEALASQPIGKSPINSNSTTDSVNVVYKKSSAKPGGEMQKPQAEYPSHLDGMMLRGGAMKGSIGYNPFEDYANVAMQRYNIEQQRLNNTLQELPTPETTEEYSTRQVQRTSEGQSDAYKAGQLDVANKELNLKQKELDAQLGKTKANTIDDLFDDKLIGQARPYLTGTEIDPNTGKAGWNIDTVRNTLQGGLIAIKQLHPEVEIPDISDLNLSDGARIDGIRKFILGYADGAFDLPFSSQGIGFVPLKPKSQLSSRARAILGSMNNYSTVTGGGKTSPQKGQINSNNNTQPIQPTGIEQWDKPNKSDNNYIPGNNSKYLPDSNVLRVNPLMQKISKLAKQRDKPSQFQNNKPIVLDDASLKEWNDYVSQFKQGSNSKAQIKSTKSALQTDSKKKIPSGYKIVKVLDGDTYILEDSKGNRSKYRASNFDTFESSDNPYTNSRIGKQAIELNNNRSEVINRGKGASQFADSLMRTNNPQIEVYENGEDNYGRKLGNIAVKGLDMRNWLDSLHKGKYITKYGDSFKNKRK